MKKIFFTLLVLFSISSFAQNHFLGLQFGLNSSRAYGVSYVENDKNINLFAAGMTYNYQFKNNILLGSGLFYDSRGSINEISLTNDEGIVLEIVDMRSKFSYLSIPLKAGYQIGQKWSGFAYLGLVPSYLLKAESMFPGVNASDDDYEERVIDIMEGLNKFDLSAMIELGSNYQLNDKLALYISGSYQRGITEVYKNADSPFIKHYRFNISLGVKYALKGE